MSAPRQSRYGWSLAARWCAGLMLAFGVHAAGAVALLTQWNNDADAVAGAPAILIDLAPAPVAPTTVPDQPIGPPQPQAIEKPAPAPEKPVEEAETEPTPEPPVEEKALERAPELKKPMEETVTPPPGPQPQFAMVALPPPRPVIKRPARKPPPQRRTSLASAPAAAERQAPHAAAPAPGAAHEPNPRAVANWKSRLVAQLERYKRFPAEAQARGEQGVSQIAFSIDRTGRVHNPRIVRSSGSNLLDRATIDLVQRAQPLPPPPADVPGTRIAIVVPIRYHIR